MISDWRGNTAIITAVTGNYDNPTYQPRIDDVDFIYFTDGKNQKDIPKPWNVAQLPEKDVDLDDRRRSKRPKLNPHSMPELLQYKYVVWIDGEIVIRNTEFLEKSFSYMKNGWVVSPHPDSVVENGRNCAYGEATIRPIKYKDEPLDEQCSFYRSEGFPENYGLYACGFSVRDMSVEKVKDTGELWHQQNITWSYQDQVSFPYCLWKTGFIPDKLPFTLYDNEWFSLNLHNKET